MKKLISVIAALMLSGAAAAQTPGGPMVPFGSGGAASFNCTGGSCTVAVNGAYSFKGPDGTTQFSTGSTNTAAEYLQAIGGITGAGGSLIAVGAASNVSVNFTAKGSANVNFGNSGSGQLAAALDPGGAVSSNGQVQLTPSTASGPTKIGNATYGVNLDCGTSKVCQIGGVPIASPFVGYLANNWYNAGSYGALNAGSAALNGKVICYPAFIYQRVTISALGVRIGTGSAGNAQAAIYANNPATMRPTGNALAATASMSTASSANVNAAVSVQLNPGLDWFCTNIDNATATLISLAPGGAQMQSVVGSATQANVLGNQVALASVSVTQTFGTWPDLTSASFTESAGNGNPVVQFKVGSVP